MRRLSSRWLACCLATLFWMTLMSAPASAQEDDALLEAQRRLNEEATEAVKSGNHERAALLLKSSIELRPLNITWLNLGRVYQQMGRCEEAMGAYEEALVAPPAEGLPEGMVADRATRWREELQATCPGALQIECRDPRTQVIVDGQARRCGERVELTPGEHEVEARLDGGRQLHTVQIGGMSQQELFLSPTPNMPTEVRDAEALGIDEEAHDVETREGVAWWVWAAGGAGAAALLAGGLVYAGANDEYNELESLVARGSDDRARYEALKADVERADAAAAGLWIGGGALLVVSGAFLFWEW